MANPGLRCLRGAVIPALKVYNLARKTRLTPIKEQKGEQQRPRISVLKKGTVLTCPRRLAHYLWA